MPSQKGLLFTLGHFNLCCPATSMDEVAMIPHQQIRQIPGVRSLLKGIFTHHQEILPLLNLSMLFQLGELEYDIVPVGVMVLSDKRKFGLTIAERTEIIDYHDEEIENLERSLRGIDRRFFLGYINAYGKMIFLLSVDSFAIYLSA